MLFRSVRVAWTGAPSIHDATNQIAATAGVKFELAMDTDSVLGTLNAVGAGLAEARVCLASAIQIPAGQATRRRGRAATGNPGGRE